MFPESWFDLPDKNMLKLLIVRQFLFVQVIPPERKYSRVRILGSAILWTAAEVTANLHRNVRAR